MVVARIQAEWAEGLRGRIGGIGPFGEPGRADAARRGAATPRHSAASTPFPREGPGRRRPDGRIPPSRNFGDFFAASRRRLDAVPSSWQRQGQRRGRAETYRRARPAGLTLAYLGAGAATISQQKGK